MHNLLWFILSLIPGLPVFLRGWKSRDLPHQREAMLEGVATACVAWHFWHGASSPTVVQMISWGECFRNVVAAGKVVSPWITQHSVECAAILPCVLPLLAAVFLHRCNPSIFITSGCVNLVIGVSFILIPYWLLRSPWFSSQIDRCYVLDNDRFGSWNEVMALAHEDDASMQFGVPYLCRAPVIRHAKDGALMDREINSPCLRGCGRLRKQKLQSECSWANGKPSVTTSTCSECAAVNWNVWSEGDMEETPWRDEFFRPGNLPARDLASYISSSSLPHKREHACAIHKRRAGWRVLLEDHQLGQEDNEGAYTTINERIWLVQSESEQCRCVQMLHQQTRTPTTNSRFLLGATLQTLGTLVWVGWQLWYGHAV